MRLRVDLHERLAAISRNMATTQIVVALRPLFLNYGYGGSKLKSAETDMPSCVENTSRFSKEGALIPRSIKLRKSTEIPRSSANCSWLIPLAERMDLTRFPNLSRRLAT